MAVVERIQGGQSEGRIGRDSLRPEPLNSLTTVRRNCFPSTPKNLPALGSALSTDQRLRDGSLRDAVQRDAVGHNYLLYVLERKVFDPAKVGRVEALPQLLEGWSQCLEP